MISGCFQIKVKATRLWKTLILFPQSPKAFSKKLNHFLIWANLLLDSRPWQEGSYDVGYVLLSVLLSGSFLGTSLLFFSENIFDVKGPYGDVVERARYFWTNPLPAKITKYGQKWPKIRVFGLFISFVWKWCRMKVLMTLQHSAKVPHVGKIWFSRNG